MPRWQGLRVVVADASKMQLFLQGACRRLVREVVGFALYLPGLEFAVLLPETGMDVAAPGAERLWRAVAELSRERMAVTVSIGLATLAGDESAQTLLARADQAIYRAKQAGKNRVAVAE